MLLFNWGNCSISSDSAVPNDNTPCLSDLALNYEMWRSDSCKLSLFQANEGASILNHSCKFRALPDHLCVWDAIAVYTRRLFKTKSKTTYSTTERILLWIRKIKSLFLFKSSFLQNLFEAFLPGLQLQKPFQNNTMYIIPRDSQLPGFLDKFYFFFLWAMCYFQKNLPL